jgi:hypothetical protein
MEGSNAGISVIKVFVAELAATVTSNLAPERG